MGFHSLGFPCWTQNIDRQMDRWMCICVSRLHFPSAPAHHVGWAHATDHLHLCPIVIMLFALFKINFLYTSLSSLSCYYSKARFVLFMLLKFKSICVFSSIIAVSLHPCFVQWKTCGLAFNWFKHGDLQWCILTIKYDLYNVFYLY